jgi:signal transduction histidine kinase
VTKPFDQVDLLRTIQSRLEKKALRETEIQQHVALFKEMLSHERSQRLFQSKLISMFSHDFHDSLTTIQFANKLLRDFVLENDTTRSIDHIDRIEAHIGQLIQTLDDMLLLGQMESGKFMLEPVPIRLESLLNHITHEFQTLHSTTHEIIFESRFSDIVTTDERLLRQIATNLLSNAIKYSPPGSVVRLTLTRYEDRCILIVKDRSSGISDTDEHEILSPSCDSQDETLSESRLELAIVKRAVEALGGTVTCEYEAGKGSTLTVVLNNVVQ